MQALQTLIAIEKDTREFGFEWPDEAMILAQIVDECREIQEDIYAKASKEKIQEEIGDLLQAAISLCLFSGFDVESTLAQVNQKFSERMTILKALTHKNGLPHLKGQSIEFMMTLWKEAKQIYTKQHHPAEPESSPLE